MNATSTRAPRTPRAGRLHTLAKCLLIACAYVLLACERSGSARVKDGLERTWVPTATYDTDTRLLEFDCKLESGQGADKVMVSEFNANGDCINVTTLNSSSGSVTINQATVKVGLSMQIGNNGAFVGIHLAE
jgi:hypothetical protein